MGHLAGRGRRNATIALFLSGALALVIFGTVMRASRAGGQAPVLLGGPQVSGAGGKFAGYREQVDVTAIGAAWHVPVVSRRSQAGAAATWIGAQGPGGSSTPFIQVGTEENMVIGTDGERVPMYATFFSDTVRHFHPDPLFPVNAGDAITAHMRLSADAWTVTITDDTTGEHRSLTTAEEGTGIFPFAEWTQEDVTSAASGLAEQYPDVSNPRMTALTVDGTPPPGAQLQSTWMSLPGGYLGPTPVTADAFSVSPMRLTPSGAAYLDIVLPVDAAGNRFYTEAGSWRASTPTATVKRETGQLAAALLRANVSLRRRRWPAAAAGQIKLLIGYQAYQAAHLPAAATESAGAVDTVALKAREAFPVDTELIRRELGVEETIQ